MVKEFSTGRKPTVNILPRWWCLFLLSLGPWSILLELQTCHSCMSYLAFSTHSPRYRDVMCGKVKRHGLLMSLFGAPASQTAGAV